MHRGSKAMSYVTGGVLDPEHTVTLRVLETLDSLRSYVESGVKRGVQAAQDKYMLLSWYEKQSIHLEDKACRRLGQLSSLRSGINSRVPVTLRVQYTARDMTIRWGIVTAGKISHDFCNAINSYPDKGDMVLAAVAARNKTKAAEFAELHKIPKVFDTYQDLATSDAIDVAYIGALNPDHYALTKLFLENGKHVLCEKPLCMNVKQAQSLIKIAKQSKLFLMEAVWSRFSPAYLALEKEIQSGKLGDMKFVEANFGVPLVSVDRLSKKDLGGSAVMDIGIYTLQFAQFIFKDEPKKVTAIGEVNDDGVDIVDTVILEYEGDRRAVLNINAKLRLWNKGTVTGTKGHATVEDPFHFPTELIHVDGKRSSFPLHESSIPYFFGNSAGLVFEALEVNRCIKEGLTESPRFTLNDSLILAKLEESVRKQVGVHYDADDQEFP